MLIIHLHPAGQDDLDSMLRGRPWGRLKKAKAVVSQVQSIFSTKSTIIWMDKQLRTYDLLSIPGYHEIKLSPWWYISREKKRYSRWTNYSWGDTIKQDLGGLVSGTPCGVM